MYRNCVVFWIFEANNKMNFWRCTTFVWTEHNCIGSLICKLVKALFCTLRQQLQVAATTLLPVFILHFISLKKMSFTFAKELWRIINDFRLVKLLEDYWQEPKRLAQKITFSKIILQTQCLHCIYNSGVELQVLFAFWYLAFAPCFIYRVSQLTKMKNWGAEVNKIASFKIPSIFWKISYKCICFARPFSAIWM